MINEKEITVFVIIPVYNCEKYIRDSVESVIQQSYKKIKIVLVDDGSTDASSDICDELAQENSRIFVIHQKNKGVSAARNRGIEYVLTTCKNYIDRIYITFLDAYDVWAPRFFGIDVVSALDKGFDLIGYQSVYCNLTLTKYAPPNRMNTGIFTGGENTLWIHNNCFGAIIYSAKFLNEYSIKFIENLKYSEDKIFKLECLYLCNSIFLDNKLMYLYRINGKSAVYNRPFGIEYFFAYN